MKSECICIILTYFEPYHTMSYAIDYDNYVDSNQVVSTYVHDSVE